MQKQKVRCQLRRRLDACPSMGSRIWAWSAPNPPSVFAYRPLSPAEPLQMSPERNGPSRPPVSPAPFHSPAAVLLLLPHYKCGLDGMSAGRDVWHTMVCMMVCRAFLLSGFILGRFCEWGGCVVGGDMGFFCVFWQWGWGLFWLAFGVSLFPS